MGDFMSEDVELEEIRKRKMLNMQRQLAEEQRRAEIEAQKQSALRLILTPEARQRLNNIKLVRPEFAEQLELQLIQISQSGKVKLPITDEQLKAILLRIQPRRDIRIRRL
jgi:programmed cell death protein 5